ncbi:BDR-repeat family protein (plasmid) [Borrelia nietonii YOR]|uniref:BDR-repeat family protein n=2 Tax=Borrelia TaxID=138 RepID=W5SB09_9SPIR|nr:MULTISPECIES: hypothetical protein [Borrelia]AHH04284.1 BDR-repeat family protein [Borrelia nietonii YOR]AHH14683.1 BDR-repeat family protein [Borrelia hermsii MTW]UPA10003.1 hypothetical protein bhYOR_001334 [Borrelia nietonii YOR]
MKKDNAILKEELKNSTAVLLEKLKVGNRMLNFISLIGMLIITFIFVYNSELFWERVMILKNKNS